MELRSARDRCARAARAAFACALSLCPCLPAAWGGVYVTPTSGLRWNDVGGLRWNDVGGLRWNDVGGLRWNDVGGLRWNDVGGVLFTEASGLRWNDVGGLRWNDVGGLAFDGALETGLTSVDLELLNILSTLPDSSSINVIVTYRSAPTASDLADLNALGVPGGTIFRRLPMVVVNATPGQIAAIAALPAVRSVYADRTLSFFDRESGALIGLEDVAADPDLAPPGGGILSGAGVTIAVIDSGVDATHPDLPLGTKVVENVRLSGAVGTAPGFIHPTPVEGVPNTDLVLGHGTFVASVAAGTGGASQGLYRGVAPGASILSLSAGDLLMVNVLEGFDYVLDNASRFGVRVVNNSWGSEGFFDPDDPVNIATRLLYDAGITVVFAAGNHGPAPDTLNAYAVAPWVVGVGSTGKDGALSDFSSRGIFEEVIYHPVLVAPGEGIIAASPVALNAVYGVVGVADPQGGVSVPPEHAAFYSVSSGTSFAAPHVAGAVALMLEARPSLTPAEIKRILQATATPILTHDRSEAGAGRLDAWAAIAAAIDSARPFGTHVPGWLDERRYRVEHGPGIAAAAALPAQSALSLPVALEGSVLSWQMTLSWGTLPGMNDLDVRILDGGGAEIDRSDAFNGTLIFGRAEGIHLLGQVPPALNVEVTFKAGSGLLEQPFQIRHEAATAVLTGYTDVGDLGAADLDVATRAVARRLLVGRGALFAPHEDLARGELARALALAAGMPQRIPGDPSFQDTPASDADYPYVETVAGARARRVLVDPKNAETFGPGGSISRLDFAVSLVRAAGREPEAQARAGESLVLADESKIPAELRGYAAIALEEGFLAPVAAAEGWKFEPKGTVPRLDAARALLILLEGPGTAASTACCGSATGGPSGGGSRAHVKDAS